MNIVSFYFNLLFRCACGERTDTLTIILVRAVLAQMLIVISTTNGWLKDQAKSHAVVALL